MIAVADTSPLCYLVLIDHVDLLPEIFDEVVVPPAVAAELTNPGAPESLRRWWAAPPPWMRIADAGGEGEAAPLHRLHPGEREAIRLAMRISSDVVLLDEKAARQAARILGLRVMGLLGVLEVAGNLGRIDLSAAVERLRRTNFRASPSLLRDLLDRHRKRS